MPALLQREQLGFLVERGGVGFSLDLTTFITPAPNHPFFIGTSLADYARRVDFFEFEDIGYLGFAPLILAGIGLRWRWRENRIWFWLGLLTAVLSLGPVLHIGREIVRVLVENDRFPILMPYAFLGQLPFFQWSRTPGRLNETTVFALMIMAAYGMATVLSWIKNQKAAGGIWLLACLLIPIEYLVRWPMPTAPIPWSPALADLARDDSFDAMMNFPVPEYTLNLTGLIQQTFHQHPMIGGRVYRDQPGALILHDFLSRMITATTESDDIAPGPTPDQRAAAFSYYGVGRIIYQPQGDADGSGRAALNTLFGAPVAADDRLSIYTLPNDRRPITDPFFVFGANWHAPQPWLAPTRWFKGIGTVYVFSPQAQRTGLAFTAIPGQDLRRLIIKVNRYEIAHFGVGDWADFETPTIQLETGLNTIEFFDEDGSWRFVGDPRCQGGSAVAGPFLYNVPCDAADRESRDYSLAIQNLRFVPEPAQPAAQATFANGLELLEATLPAQSKPGEAIIVHLAWRATQTLPQDYTLFLHLVGANGQLIAGNDSPPARGSLPTTRWRAGQVVKYNAPLILPPDAPPGNYTLSLGWYAWPSLERLSLPDGETAFTIGALQVSGNG